ncbi:MAG: N-acetylneuraminate synthase family protein [Gammaproteobacteria bacterium]|nr:N-acetylneuraminate synthase family protein [Gammaproteobacteria bacterium]
MDFVSRKFDFNPGERCIVIGEIGVNHNNDRDTLFKLLDAGSHVGCDIIKLQRFKAEDEIAESAPTTEYQVKAGEGDSQLEMAKKLELPDELLVEAYEYCQQMDIGFLCTAFDHGSVDFVADVLGCKSVKVPSPEITNRPLIEYMAQKFDALLVSTGASDLDEVAAVIEWIRNIGDREIALMHCTSEYPAPIDQVNLTAINTMRAAFELPVGYSDHTRGVVAGTVAASLGAAMIEKHYTLDKNMPGPDHNASADIPELTQLVKAMKDVSLCLGDGIKRPVAAEAKNRLLIRKGFTCALDSMPAGTLIDASMLGIKRPLVKGAVEPFDLDKIVGQKISKSKRFDEPILWSDFNL